MIKLNQITSFLDNYLDTKNVKDGSWNGLQVEGKEEVEKIMFAVDAGMETFEKAVEINADMIVVHHGMFWQGVNPCVKGYTKDRVQFLLKNGIYLYASHLPLDKHPIVGNNAQLIKLLGFEKDKEFGMYAGDFISFTGKTDNPKTIKEIESILKKEIGATCKTLPFGKEQISTIAVCSGGGGYSQLVEAMDCGVDLYLTGDSTEMYHFIKDSKFNVIFAGHHATETVGVKALSKIVEKELNVKTIFVDIPTGL